MASAMRQNEKNRLPTRMGSETMERIGDEGPATRGRWNQGHLALLKSVGLPADFIFGRGWISPLSAVPDIRHPGLGPGTRFLLRAFAPLVEILRREDRKSVV